MWVWGCLQHIRWEGRPKINLSVKSHFLLALKFCLILVFAREAVRACRAGRRIPAPLSDESLQFNKLQWESCRYYLCVWTVCALWASATSWMKTLENASLSEKPKSSRRDRNIQFDSINGPVAEKCCKRSEGSSCFPAPCFSTDTLTVGRPYRFLCLTLAVVAPTVSNFFPSLYGWCTWV